tara:strand:- start:781 stop:951 length:171 start_codon:yes stop_codon:yes gene_type:complete
MILDLDKVVVAVDNQMDESNTPQSVSHYFHLSPLELLEEQDYIQWGYQYQFPFSNI